MSGVVVQYAVQVAVSWPMVVHCAVQRWLMVADMVADVVMARASSITRLPASWSPPVGLKPAPRRFTVQVYLAGCGQFAFLRRSTGYHTMWGSWAWIPGWSP